MAGVRVSAAGVSGGAFDPFGTAGLRAGVLAAWRDSPTRLREDAATEADLVRAGYRDRLLTELAQNAADAAAKAGVPGRLVVRLVDDVVHISNTGAPLDISGVHALTALRASGKADPATSVGRFGVGFTAVRTVSDEIEVRSTTGSLRFSRDLTWKALRDNAITVPDDTFTPPVLRLAWPIEAAPAPGADTEIVLTLRPDVDPQGLLAAMRAEAADLLLELPALQYIRIGDDELTSTVTDLHNPYQPEHGGPGSHRAAGIRAVRIDGPGAERRTWWEFRTARARWLLPVRDGRPVPAAHDVLRAPTRSDEELSLPALLIADIPMQPDRRRVLPGARLAELAGGYADFARALPPRDRLVLVPVPGFARSEVDGLLREALVRELQIHSWLPVVTARPNPVDGPRTGSDAAESEGWAFPDDAPTATVGSPLTSSPTDIAAAQSITAPHERTAVSIGKDTGPLDAEPEALATSAPVIAESPDGLGVTAVPTRASVTESGAPIAIDGIGIANDTGPLDAEPEDLAAASPIVAESPDGPGMTAVPTRASVTESGAPIAIDGIGIANDTGPLDAEPEDLAVASPIVAESPDGRGVTAVPTRASVTESGEPIAVAGIGKIAAPLDAESGVSAAGPPVIAPPATMAVPTRASVFTGLSRELAELLDDVVGPLVIPELSGRAHTEALGVLDVHRIGLARLAELSGGLERSPKWWQSLYAALEPYVVDPLAAEELGALAVPLADGRLVTGPRTVVLDDQLEVAIPVHWARLVHPEAVHPLLARLGARSATAEDLLTDPGLRAELDDQPDDPDTVDAVLRLAAHADPSALPSWLGLLELPDSAGDLLPADELLLPDAPLRALLVADSPFGTVAADLVDRYGADALRAVGVGWDFSIVVESDPTGPDHHLDDEERWWTGLSEDPPELAAVRDLDLVAESCWPAALRQLASAPRTHRLLTDPEGYTAWWLRSHARIDGTPLGLLRHPADTEFADLLPAFELSGLDSAAMRAVLANPNAITHELAAALLDALADPAKTPTPEVVSRTHARLAAAVAADQLDLTDLELPDRVRALSAVVVDPDDVWVLDQPWFGLALPPDRLVAGDIATAPALATLLDLPLVSESITAEVISAGRRTTWSAEPLGIVLRQLFTLPEEGDLVLHDALRIRLHGALDATVAVPWWRDGATTHIQTSYPSA
ncbi:sacsin N-terminal ATP-binding-like domain-containing protein [Nocardia sp. CA-129566]|uniref:sacsin N-terminal ATP-binding-like domain-containing protein n=1 Tax=Nocardia sp. CA-129566 TaxID=3239976 RepID=UPI003D98A879